MNAAEEFQDRLIKAAGYFAILFIVNKNEPCSEKFQEIIKRINNLLSSYMNMTPRERSDVLLDLYNEADKQLE